jgi:hypothetical protein
MLGNLAIKLQTRFEQADKAEDLNEAITLNRESLALRPPGHPGRSRILGNLAEELHTRFQQAGREEDLDEAIDFLLESDNSMPPLHPLHAWCRGTLAAVYLQYHDHDSSKVAFISKAFEVFSSSKSNSPLRVYFSVGTRSAQKRPRF